MGVEIKITCPLGSKCEEVVDGELCRCAWYVQMTGVDAQGNDTDEWRCSMAWMPILQVETARSERGTSAAVESLRNETVKRQDLALRLAAQKQGLKLLVED